MCKHDLWKNAKVDEAASDFFSESSLRPSFRTPHAIFHIFSKISRVMSTHGPGFLLQTSHPPITLHFPGTNSLPWFRMSHPTIPFFFLSFMTGTSRNHHGISQAIYQWENKANPTHSFMIILISASAILSLTNESDLGSSVRTSRLSCLKCFPNNMI